MPLELHVLQTEASNANRQRYLLEAEARRELLKAQNASK